MIKYRREMGTGFIAEAMPMFRRHWMQAESHLQPDLDPDFVKINSAVLYGALRVYTARDGERIVGYLAFVIPDSHLHYRRARLAVQDAIYVDPAYRGRASIELIAFAEDDLRDAGIELVTQVEKVRAPFGKLLARMGYEHEENVWIKRLVPRVEQVAQEA